MAYVEKKVEFKIKGKKYYYYLSELKKLLQFKQRQK